MKRAIGLWSEELYVYFSEEDTEMANWYVKRHSKSLIIKSINTESTNLASYGIC